MERRQQLVDCVLLPFVLFIVAFAIRRYLFAGFVLCNDAEEYPLIRQLATFGLTYSGHLEYRFEMWIFNVAFFKLLGISEASFFLPTWIRSASLAAIAYFLFLHWQYRRWLALAAGLFIAAAPFEVVIGTVRANQSARCRLCTRRMTHLQPRRQSGLKLDACMILCSLNRIL